MPTVYEIRVGGHVDPCWSEWLEGMRITQMDNGNSLLAGPVQDQAALHGLLNRIRDMNLNLIGVERKEE